jgi:hypothetical protein
MIGWLTLLSLVIVQIGISWWTTTKIARKLDCIAADMHEALQRFNLS